MSQAGIINVIENNPDIPINFEASTGSATALFNTIRFIGTGGIVTSATGNTVTIDGSSISASVTLDGNTGSATGSTISIVTANGTPSFDASGSSVILNMADSNQNTFIGTANANTSIIANGASQNTGIGVDNLQALTSGAHNLSAGYFNLESCDTGSSNVALGYGIFQQFTSGSYNIGIGQGAGASLKSTSSYNVMIGFDAGVNCVNGTSSSNIYLSNLGNDFENNTMRLGTTGSGDNQVNSTFIAGISGVTVGGTPSMVVINPANDQMGVAAIPSTTTVSATNAGATVFFTQTGSNYDLNVSDGNGNTFIGASAGNTGGTSVFNTFLGVQSGSSNATGNSNVGLGRITLNANSSGSNNVAIGNGSQYQALGSENISIGSQSLFGVVTGVDNVIIGHVAAINVTGTASTNTVLGAGSWSNVTPTGNNNCIIGGQSGNAYTGAESNNILLGTSVSGVVGESNAIHIGSSHTTFFAAGINGVTVTGTAVICSTAGQLGTVVSSARYKDNIKDMPSDTSVLDLRPVQFNYKSDEEKKIQYGLIAEEVEKDFPYLCFYNDQGIPESVKYHELPVFLLKEIQKLNERINLLEGKGGLNV